MNEKRDLPLLPKLLTLDGQWDDDAFKEHYQQLLLWLGKNNEVGEERFGANSLTSLSGFVNVMLDSYLLFNPTLTTGLLNVPHNSLLNFTYNDFEVNLRFRVSDTTAGTLITKTLSSYQGGWACYFQSGKLYVLHKVGAQSYGTGTDWVVDNLWHTLKLKRTFVLHGVAGSPPTSYWTLRIEAIVDGVSFAVYSVNNATIAPFNADNTQALTIGDTGLKSSVSQVSVKYENGAVWNQHPTTGVTWKTPGVWTDVASWLINEGTGTNINETVNNLDGTLTGDYEWSLPETVQQSLKAFSLIDGTVLGEGGTLVVGDVTGVVNKLKLQGDVTKIGEDVPVTDDSLVWNGTKWIPKTPVPTIHDVDDPVRHSIGAGTSGKLMQFDTTKILKDATNTDTEVASAVSHIALSELLANKATDFSVINDTKYPTVKATNDAIVAAVVGLLDYRGTYDAHLNAFPTTGGSGPLGVILKGDFWMISVAGTLGTKPVTAGDLVIALVDTPAQTASNWDIIEYGLDYVPENVTNKDAVSGYAGLDGSQLVIKNPANATATPTASKIPIADGSGKVDGWVSGDKHNKDGDTDLDSTFEATFVKTTGDQTVAGEKTLTGNTKITKSTPTLTLEHSDGTQTIIYTDATGTHFKTKASVAGSLATCLTLANATNNNVQTPSFALSNANNQLTIAGVINVSSTTDYQQCLFSTGVSPNPFIAIRFYKYTGDNTITIFARYASGSVTVSWTNVYLNLWDLTKHIVITINFTTGKANLYIDGVVKTEQTFAQTPLFPNTNQIKYFGSYNAGWKWTGTMDEMAVYNTVKDQTWVTADYNAGSYTHRSSSADMEVGYHFNEGTGTALDDISVNNRDGTIGSAVTWTSPGYVNIPGAETEIEVLKFIENTGASVKGITYIGSDGTAMVLPSLTTAQRDAINSVPNGTIILNTTTNAIDIRINSAWISIGTGTITLAMMANMATASWLGRQTAGAGVPEVLSKSDVLAMLNVEDGANNYIHPDHFGDVTSIADGEQFISLATVTLSHMAPLGRNNIITRTTAGSGMPQALEITEQTVLGRLSGGVIKALTQAELTDLAVPSESVTYAKMQHVEAESVIANNTGSATDPKGIALAEQTVLGRITGGHVVALTVAQVKTLLGVGLLLQSKVKSESRVMSVANGDVAYTGYGFKPSSIIIKSFINGNNKSCLGFTDSAKASVSMSQGHTAGFLEHTAAVIIFESDALYAYATVVSYDTDGFTLAWTKVLAPTSTIAMEVIAYS